MEIYKKGDWKTIIGLIVALGLIISVIELYQNWSIKEYKETFGIYVGRTGGVGDATMHFKYKTFNNDLIETGDKFRYNAQLKIGDTVWIRYSTYDNKIIKVVDLNYKKHLK